LAWSGARLYWRPPPEETGGVYVAESYNLFAALWPLAAAIAVWASGSAALLIARAARRRREAPRARRVVTTIAVAAGLCVLALLLIPSKRSESLGPVLVQTKAPPRGQPYRLLDGFSRLPVTHDRLTGPA